jgi:hypothetical protein
MTNANGGDLDALLPGKGNLAPYIAAAGELGLSADDIAVGLAMLSAPDSRLRIALADVLRRDFASPAAALANLRERLAELDPLEARLLLALVAGANKAAG